MYEVLFRSPQGVECSKCDKPWWSSIDSITKVTYRPHFLLSTYVERHNVRPNTFVVASPLHPCLATLSFLPSSNRWFTSVHIPTPPSPATIFIRSLHQYLHSKRARVYFTWPPQKFAYSWGFVSNADQASLNHVSELAYLSAAHVYCSLMLPNSISLWCVNNISLQYIPQESKTDCTIKFTGTIPLKYHFETVLTSYGE